MMVDTGLEPLKSMMELHKNPKAGLNVFSSVFSHWFNVLIPYSEGPITNLEKMRFIEAELFKPENRTLLKIAANIIKPQIEAYLEEEKPDWFSIAENLVNSAAK